MREKVYVISPVKMVINADKNGDDAGDDFLLIVKIEIIINANNKLKRYCFTFYN